MEGREPDLLGAEEDGLALQSTQDLDRGRRREPKARRADEDSGKGGIEALDFDRCGEAIDLGSVRVALHLGVDHAEPRRRARALPEEDRAGAGAEGRKPPRNERSSSGRRP